VCIYAPVSEIAQQPLLVASTAFLLLFAVIAAWDGLVLHLWTYRLHARPESYREHLWHTASAVLFAPAVVVLFVAAPRGPVLWIGIALLAGVHAVEVFDVRAERTSRLSLGGLSRTEFSIHVAAFVTRSIAVGLLLVSLPAQAWSLSASPAVGSAPALLTLANSVVAGGSLVVAVVHVWLAVRHCPGCVRRPCCPQVAA
jgi:hypothetical protein